MENKVMKTEQLDKFVGKHVRITFYDDNYAEGILGSGSICFGTYGWMGKGYHLYPCKSHNGSVSFKKSHVKKIKEI